MPRALCTAVVALEPASALLEWGPEAAVPVRLPGLLVASWNSGVPARSLAPRCIQVGLSRDISARFQLSVVETLLGNTPRPSDAVPGNVVVVLLLLMALSEAFMGGRDACTPGHFRSGQIDNRVPLGFPTTDVPGFDSSAVFVADTSGFLATAANWSMKAGLVDQPGGGV